MTEAVRKIRFQAKIRFDCCFLFDFDTNMCVLLSEEIKSKSERRRGLTIGRREGGLTEAFFALSLCPVFVFDIKSKRKCLLQQTKKLFYLF